MVFPPPSSLVEDRVSVLFVRVPRLVFGVEEGFNVDADEAILKNRKRQRVSEVQAT